MANTTSTQTLLNTHNRLVLKRCFVYGASGGSDESPAIIFSNPGDYNCSSLSLRRLQSATSGLQIELFTPPTTGDSVTGDVLTNGGMETWTNPTTLTDWTLDGVGAAVAREATIIKQGTYSAKLTRALASTYLFREVTTEGGKVIGDWKGKYVTFGAWVYATEANCARLAIEDYNILYSSYHSGTPGWEYLIVTKIVSNSASGLWVELYNDLNSSSCYIDGASFIQGRGIGTILRRGDGMGTGSPGTQRATMSDLKIPCDHRKESGLLPLTGNISQLYLSTYGGDAGDSYSMILDFKKQH